MTTASEIQTLLRFLSQDAKLPMTKAMTSIKQLQSLKLTTPELIATSSVVRLAPLFSDDARTAKQVLSAAKRLSKKRSAPDDAEASRAPVKRVRKSQFELQDTNTIGESPESALALPMPNRDTESIASAVLITNRAPLVLAFGIVLLQYTMPSQPLSSRLSLAQAAVSANSRSKAVSLGIEHGKSAEEEGWGMGQAVVRVMGREVRTMRRAGWEPEVGEITVERVVKNEDMVKTEDADERVEIKDRTPAYWALDLEALKKHNGGFNDGTGVGLESSLPIYTPQSARAYLMRSFSARVEAARDKPARKGRGQFTQRVEENVALLLGALELLFESWNNLSAIELDQRAWGWYVAVRPDVADGVSGWGQKGELRLRNLLDLRRSS